MLVLSVQGDTVERLAWRHLGTTTGVVEATLAANPGLADMGPVLPDDTPVYLAQPAAGPAVAATVNLWD